MKNKYLLFIVSFFITTITVNSQVINFWKIDETKFPNIEVMYTARNGLGQYYYESNNPLKASDFVVTENGLPMTVTLDDSKRVDTPGVSIMMLLDRSTSLLDEPDLVTPLLTWEKNGAIFLVDSLYFLNGTKLAFASFGNRLNSDNKMMNFQNTPNNFKEKINSLETSAAGSTSYYHAFGGAAKTPFEMFKTQTSDKLPRAIVLCTDSDESEVTFTSVEANKIIDAALDAKVTIFIITMMKNTNFELQEIARITGGKTFSNLKSQFDVYKAFGEVAHIMQIKPRSYVKFTAPYGCDEASKTRNIHVEITTQSVSWDGAYTAPDNSIPSFELSANELTFNKPGSGTTEKSLTVTNYGPKLIIDTIVLQPWGSFVVSNWTGGKNVEIDNGKSYTFKLDFAKKPPVKIDDVTLTFVSNFSCPESVPTATLSVKWWGAEFTGEDITFDTTLIKTSSEKSLNKTLFKNTSSHPITVNVSVKSDADGDFSLVSGGGETTLAPDETIDNITVKFAPNVKGNGTKTAIVDFDVTSPNDFPAGTYEIKLKGFTKEDSGVEEWLGVSGESLMLNAEPNPASDEVTITFDVPVYAYSTLELFNAIGEKIETLAGANLNGKYGLTYSTAKLPSGTYFLRLKSGELFSSMRLIINK